MSEEKKNGGKQIVVVRRVFKHGGTSAITIPNEIKRKFNISLGCRMIWRADNYGITIERDSTNERHFEII